MPLYDYACTDCGHFKDWQSMSRAAEPADCPDCGRSAGRVVTAPFIANMNPHNRTAHQRNEKSAHEPQVIRKEHSYDAERHPHRHGRQGHCHGHGRPWMIGH